MNLWIHVILLKLLLHSLHVITHFHPLSWLMLVCSRCWPAASIPSFCFWCYCHFFVLVRSAKYACKCVSCVGASQTGDGLSACVHGRTGGGCPVHVLAQTRQAGKKSLWSNEPAVINRAKVMQVCVRVCVCVGGGGG